MDFIHGFDWDESITEAWWTSAGMPAAPSLYIDFSRATARRANLIRTPDQLMAFTRNSAATFIDGAGQIKTAAINTPRYDWRTGRRGLLIEAAQTNLALYSEPASNDQTSARSGISYVAGFDGFESAVAFGNNSESRFCYVGPSLVADNVYTVYAYVRMDDGGAPVVASGNSGAHDFALVLGGNASAGVVKPVVHLGGGLYRVGMTRTVTSATGNNGVVKYSGLSNRGFRVTGIQVFAGDVAAPSYIKTNGGALTRAADVASYDLAGIDLSGGYTVMASYRLSGHIGTLDRVLQLDSGATDTTQHIRYTSSTNNMGAFVNSAGQLEASGSLGSGYGATETTGFTVGPNMFQCVSRAGGLGVLDTTVNYVAPNMLRLGSDVTGRQPAQLTIFKLALWAQPMSPADLQAAWGAIQ